MGRILDVFVYAMPVRFQELENGSRNGSPDVF